MRAQLMKHKSDESKDSLMNSGGRTGNRKHGSDTTGEIEPKFSAPGWLPPVLIVSALLRRNQPPISLR